LLHLQVEFSGDYTFTFQDWLERKTFEDEIGRNCYYIDVHKPGHKETRYKKGESHGIPYRCLTPKGMKNLLTAGRCISTDEEAFGSLRVMPPCLVTGEAAGMAAVHAIKQTKNDVHKIDVGFLRKRLKEEGQYFL
ncbi:FAD-dependent oxidoreductase, partial [Bacteroides ovatus]|uniref:FAD-dependent oxidoreductase n=1 Tax=Bacteroides ovatus TaxID=28116 RepID=UPI0032C07091